MTGSESRTSGIGSDRSINSATTTALMQYYLKAFWHFNSSLLHLQ